MIRENVSVTVNSYTLDGEIIVPSVVMTSTPQEENGDLSYAPNFLLKLDDAEKTLNVTDTVEAEFTLGEYNYTSNMKVVNRAGNKVTLQYVDGMTKEEGEPPVTGPGFEYAGQQIITSFTGTWTRYTDGYICDTSVDPNINVEELYRYNGATDFNFLYNGEVYIGENAGTIRYSMSSLYDEAITFDPSNGFYINAGVGFQTSSSTGEAQTITSDVYAMANYMDLMLYNISLMRQEETGKYLCDTNDLEYDSIDDFINAQPEEFRQYFNDYEAYTNEGEDTPYNYEINVSQYQTQILNYWNGMSAKIGTATMEIAAYVPARSITCDPTPIDMTFTIETEEATGDEYVTGDGSFSFSVTDNLDRDRTSEVTVEWSSIAIRNNQSEETITYYNEDLEEHGFTAPSYDSMTGKIVGYVDPQFFEPEWLSEDYDVVGEINVTVENVYTEQQINFSGETVENEPTIGDLSFTIDSSNYDQASSSFTDNGDNTWTADLVRTYTHGDFNLPFSDADGNVIFDAANMFNNNQGDPIFDIIIDEPNEYNASATFRTAPSYGSDDEMLGSITAAIGNYELSGKIRTNVSDATVYLTDADYNAITNAGQYYTYDGSQYDEENDGVVYKRYTLDLTSWQNAEGNAVITLEVFDPNGPGR